MKALVAEAFAVPVNAAEVMASWVPVPAVMVSCWVPDVSPAAAAVTVGRPRHGVAVVEGRARAPRRDVDRGDGRRSTRGGSESVGAGRARRQVDCERRGGDVAVGVLFLHGDRSQLGAGRRATRYGARGEDQPVRPHQV